MNKKYMSVSLVGAICIGLGGCQFDGGPLIDENTEHKIHFGQSTSDTQALSLSVKKAIRANAFTSLLLIDVSTISEGTVRLSGTVDSMGARADAERVAGKVEGVDFVINSLFVN